MFPYPGPVSVPSSPVQSSLGKFGVSSCPAGLYGGEGSKAFQLESGRGLLKKVSKTDALYRDYGDSNRGGGGGGGEGAFKVATCTHGCKKECVKFVVVVVVTGWEL